MLSLFQSGMVWDPRGACSGGEGENLSVGGSVLVLIQIEVEQQEQLRLAERLV